MNKKDSVNNKDSKEEALFSGPGIAAGPDIESESHFFTYFMLLSLVAIVAYLVFHNKQKVRIHCHLFITDVFNLFHSLVDFGSNFGRKEKSGKQT